MVKDEMTRMACREPKATAPPQSEARFPFMVVFPIHAVELSITDNAAPVYASFPDITVPAKCPTLVPCSVTAPVDPTPLPLLLAMMQSLIVSCEPGRFGYEAAAARQELPAPAAPLVSCDTNRTAPAFPVAVVPAVLPLIVMRDRVTDEEKDAASPPPPSLATFPVKVPESSTAGFAHRESQTAPPSLSAVLPVATNPVTLVAGAKWEVPSMYRPPPLSVAVFPDNTQSEICRLPMLTPESSQLKGPLYQPLAGVWRVSPRMTSSCCWYNI
mmetsp:Transcript_8876/g.22019  ORF Transcript_8876/g.22019 Transcript_8876/m.22019 type:complete len:271 (-) Transcript_8876:1693-2505(-)